MKEERSKSNKWLVFAIISYFILWTIRSLTNNLYIGSDVEYLTNRLAQIHKCFEDRIIPFFYYDDFNGVGYGSSFYYGGITLYPFAIFKSDVAIKLFTLIVPILLIFSIRCFVSRLVDDEDGKVNKITFIITQTEFLLNFIATTGFYANIYGLVFGVLTLAFGIDFFRDNKPHSSFRLSICFLLLLNTHLVTTVITSIGLILICIYYFDKTRIKNYLNCFLYTLFISSYNIVNMIIHSGVVNNTDNINRALIPNGVMSEFTFNVVPFQETVIRYATNSLTHNFTLIGSLQLVILIVVLVKYKDSIFQYKTNRKIIYLTICLVSVIIGVDLIWKSIFAFINIPIQFPIRYGLYLILFVFCLICRRMDKRLLKVNLAYSMVCSIVFLVLLNVMNIVTSDNRPYASQIVNGEYLDKSFVYDTKEFEKNAQRVIDVDTEKEYPYEIKKDKVVIDLTDNTSKVIQIPKLYYYGYIAYTEDKQQLDVSMGYSQFINVNVEGVNSQVVVYYRHPVILIILLVFIGISLIYFSLYEFYL